MSFSIVKRDGTREGLNIEKLHKVVEYACDDLTGVSVSEVELRSHIQFYDKMTTKEIQETLIKSAADLISEDSPNYQFVAGRLISYDLRKEVFNQFEPPRLYKHVKRIVKKGFYEEKLLDWYTQDEFDTMDTWIDHSRDEHMTYAAMEQMRGKYLVKNRATKIIYETPQLAFMLIAATLFHKYTDKRMQTVREFYDALSTFDISLPTPVMAGVRTSVRQFSSCVLDLLSTAVMLLIQVLYLSLNIFNPLLGLVAKVEYVAALLLCIILYGTLRLKIFLYLKIIKVQMIIE